MERVQVAGPAPGPGPGLGPQPGYFVLDRVSFFRRILSFYIVDFFRHTIFGDRYLFILFEIDRENTLGK